MLPSCCCAAPRNFLGSSGLLGGRPGDLPGWRSCCPNPVPHAGGGAAVCRTPHLESSPQAVHPTEHRGLCLLWQSPRAGAGLLCPGVRQEGRAAFQGSGLPPFSGQAHASFPGTGLHLRPAPDRLWEAWSPAPVTGFHSLLWLVVESYRPLLEDVICPPGCPASLPSWHLPPCCLGLHHFHVHILCCSLAGHSMRPS